MSPPYYRLSPFAADQFETLLYSIAEHSGWKRSMRVEEKLYADFHVLAANPGLGHRRPDLTHRDVYFYYSEPYQILYRRDTAPLYILAIYHGARNIEVLIREEYLG